MAQPRKILTVLLLSAAPAVTVTLPTAAANPGSVAAPRAPRPDAEVPRALLALRSRLFEVGEQAARADLPRFRPLCDADGYPLVGNVASKGERFQPSELCALVRERAR